jgi:acetyl-CoA carboxylase biotin carboxyl carrier protein
VEQAQPLTHADVERIIELAEEGGFSYLRLESDGVELTLVRDGAEPPAATSVQVRPAAGTPAPAAVPQPAPAPAATGPSPVAPTVVEPAPEPSDAGTDVVSPMIGIVYLAPTPTAEPYVRVGQAVQAGDTVALVEVMKMFTPVQAGVGGVVRAVLVTNGEHVDRGQPLLRVGK